MKEAVAEFERWLSTEVKEARKIRYNREARF